MCRSTKQLPSLILLIFSLGACVNDSESPAPVQSASFKLADGSPISEGAYDDYHPILVQLSNNNLVLVFASKRPCGTCVANNSSIFIAPSISPYANDGKLPAFYPPQVILENAGAKSYSSRIRLAVQVSGTTFNVFIKDATGNISQTGSITAVPNVSPDVFGTAADIANYYCYSGTLLGLDASGLMISTAGPSGPISRYNPSGGDMCPYNTFANTAMATAVNISTVRAADIGISEGFLVADSAGRLSAHTATSSGPVIQNFSDAMTRNSLYMTSATVFKANAAAGDLLVFSAAPSAGANSDMYIIANKTPSALWLKYTPFGTQPKP